MQHWLEVYSQEFENPRSLGQLIETQAYFVQVGLREARQMGFLGQLLSQHPVGVLVRAALPRTLRSQNRLSHWWLRSSSCAAPSPTHGPRLTAPSVAGVCERAGLGQRPNSCTLLAPAPACRSATDVYHVARDVACPAKQITLPMTGTARSSISAGLPGWKSHSQSVL